MWHDDATMPRRILIFSLVYYPQFVGGAEVAIKEITDRIPPDEVEFHMVTLRLDSRLPRFEKIGNVNIYRVGWSGTLSKTNNPRLPWYISLNKYAYLFTGFLKALSLHKKYKYSAIWSLMATYNTFAALFFKLLNPKVPFIFTLQDGDPIPYLKRRALPLYPFFKMFFTRADHITAISTYLADWAKNMGAKCPITVIPNAVDYDLFARPIPDGEVSELKRTLNKKEGDVFLITSSRLVKKNAIDDIISALTFLPANVKLLILGTGDELLNLSSLILNLKLEHRVQMLGYIPHNQLPPYLRISDIFIRPSLSEGLGNSFLEAMAAGIPVIGTPVGGIPDFLKDGETGLFCEVRNPRSIAQKVEKLLKDKESRDYIVNRARRLVEEKYGWAKVAGEMSEVLVPGRR